MRLGRAGLVGAGLGVGALIAVVTLLAFGWRPAFGPVNARATEAVQAAIPWFGFTPFSPFALSVGLTVLTLVLLTGLIWVTSAHFVPPVLGRLPEMIPARRHNLPEPQSLVELLENLVEIQRRQHADLIQRIEALEADRAAPRPEPRIVQPAARAYPDDDDFIEAAGSTRPVYRDPPAAAAAPLVPGKREILQAIEAEYRTLLTDPTAPGFRNFFQTRKAFGLETSGDRLVRTRAPGALLYAIPVGDGLAALAPGYDFVSDFGTAYFAQRSVPDEVKLAFDFDVDGSRILKLASAARASLDDDGSYRIDERGVLGGLAA